MYVIHYNKKTYKTYYQFVNLFNKYLLSNYRIQGTVPANEGTIIEKQRSLFSWNLHLSEEIDSRKYTKTKRHFQITIKSVKTRGLERGGHLSRMRESKSL